MTTYNRIIFNDGEALTHGDLNNLQAGLTTEMLEAATDLSGARLGNVAALAYAVGMDPFLAGGHLRGDAMHANRIYTPAPMSGIIIPNSGTAPTTLSLGKGILVQRRTASTPGSPVSSDVPSIDTPLVHGMSASVRNLVTDITANAPPGGGNSRWDTWGVQLEYERATESRNSQDAVTGALSSSSVDKNGTIGINTEFVTGPQSASFDMATLTAGFVPILTKRRPITSDPSPYVPGDFYYHAYPMRLGVETLFPEDARLSGTSYLDDGTNGWLVSGGAGIIGTYAYKGTPGTGYAYYYPRHMHAGTRLVGVSFLTYSATNSPDSIRLMRVTVDSAGAAVGTSLVDIDAIHARVGTATSTGWRGVGESDWSSATKPLPIWGNGRSYGPLFSDYRRDLSADAVSPYAHAEMDFLALEVQLTTTRYVMGPVRFYYLY